MYSFAMVFHSYKDAFSRHAVLQMKEQIIHPCRENKQKLDTGIIYKITTIGARYNLKATELNNRTPIQHSGKTGKCGHSCHMIYLLIHLSVCKESNESHNRVTQQRSVKKGRLRDVF